MRKWNFKHMTRQARRALSKKKGAADLLRALGEGGEGEEASLTRFRNFMYKTVGLGKEK